MIFRPRYYAITKDAINQSDGLMNTTGCYQPIRCLNQCQQEQINNLRIVHLDAWVTPRWHSDAKVTPESSSPDPLLLPFFSDSKHSRDSRIQPRPFFFSPPSQRQEIMRVARTDQNEMTPPKWIVADQSEAEDGYRWDLINELSWTITFKL